MSIEDPPASDGFATNRSIEGEVFNEAVLRATSFAKLFSLVYDDLCMSNQYAPGAPDRWCSFDNFKEEGILLNVHYDSATQVTVVFLMKEPRWRGKYSKSEVKEAFDRLVASPLVTEFGSRVRVEQ